jgi:hypothetical protein
MITPDLDIEEPRAIASPRDYPEDFDKPTCWNCCERCIKPFIGLVTRIQCRVCNEGGTL